MRYADDFIVTARDPDLLTQRVIPAIVQFLAERGLALSPEKTGVVHLRDGFDFLGQTIRKLGRKLNIQPSKDSVHRLLDKLRTLMHLHRGRSAADLIQALNTRLRGWCTYHRYVQATRAFVYVDWHVGCALRCWARRRHSGKSWRWINQRYFPAGWACFMDIEKRSDGQRVLHQMYCAVTTRLYRYIKIRGAASPMNPACAEYFDMRNRRPSAKPVVNPARFVWQTIAGS